MSDQLYTIRAILTGIHSPPLMAKNDNDAKQTVVAAASGGMSNLGKYPSQYELYLIGEYDVDTGHGEFYQTKKFIISVEGAINEFKNYEVERIKHKVDKISADRAEDN